MKIIKSSSSIFVDKGDGTSVNYYLFPEYEVHYNEIRPHATQQWHHHQQIEENLYIISGTLTAHWRDGEKEQSEEVGAGDMIRVEDTPHTFSNESEEVVRFIVFRFVPDGEDKSQVIKADKVLD